MANSGVFSVRLEGFEAIRNVLRQLPDKLRDKVLAKAVAKAAKPLVENAKALAPVRTGALKRSIAAVVRRSRKTGEPFAVVGAERGRYFRGGKALRGNADRRGADQPANYAHLVEFGHYSAAGTGISVASAKGTRIKTGKRRSSKRKAMEVRSFILPKPFMRPAVARSGNDVAMKMAETIEAELAKEADKLAKTPTSKG